ncbi:hypothetical protein HDU67_004577 [Dinochytrium kinnereticum]|nr:hypothetical protein HDU67_004577 [Dinochytrium kinnereticum]
MAKAMLFSKLSKKYLQMVYDKEHSKEIWDTLISVHRVKTIGEAMHLRRQLLSVSLKPNVQMSDHVAHISSIVHEYDEISANKISNEEHVVALLQSLPKDDPNWSALKTFLENDPLVTQAGVADVELVRQRLIQHAAKIRHQEAVDATSAPAALQVQRRDNRGRKPFHNQGPRGHQNGLGG